MWYKNRSRARAKRVSRNAYAHYGSYYNKLFTAFPVILYIYIYNFYYTCKLPTLLPFIKSHQLRSRSISWTTKMTTMSVSYAKSFACYSKVGFPDCTQGHWWLTMFQDLMQLCNSSVLSCSSSSNCLKWLWTLTLNNYDKLFSPQDKNVRVNGACMLRHSNSY